MGCGVPRRHLSIDRVSRNGLGVSPTSFVEKDVEDVKYVSGESESGAVIIQEHLGSVMGVNWGRVKLESVDGVAI